MASGVQMRRRELGKVKKWAAGRRAKEWSARSLSRAFLVTPEHGFSISTIYVFK